MSGYRRWSEYLNEKSKINQIDCKWFFFSCWNIFLRYRCVDMCGLCVCVCIDFGGCRRAHWTKVFNRWSVGFCIFFFKKTINFTFFKQHCVQWAHPMSIFQRYSLELTVHLQIPTYSLYVIISSLYSLIHFLSLCVCISFSSFSKRIIYML